MPRRSPATGLLARLLAGLLAAVVTLAACNAPETDRAPGAAGPGKRAPGGSPHRSTAPDAGGAGLTGSAPRTPPARICGSAGLRGPEQPPEGARRVTTADHLDRLAANAPPGTTFWLAPGVHRLGTAQYSQVRPRDGQTFIGAPGAVLDGQHRNLYAFTGYADHVRIEHLTIQGFGSPGDNPDQGVVNHDSGHDWVVRDNTIRDNAGAGLFIGTGGTVVSNCLSGNGQYGFSVYGPHGVRDVTLRHNEVVGNNTDDWESRQPGCGCTGGGKFWDTRNARIIDNWVHGNRGVGLWADTDNTEFLVRGNYVSGNASQGMIYETSYNAAIVANTFVRNGLADGPHCDCFPVSALYISESGSDPRAGSRFGATFEVAGNRFVDNWSGIIAWENADRFAGSPNNTSTGYTTLVNPRVATVRACGDPTRIGTKPYVDDCRWKTTRLRIHDNLFAFTPAHLGPTCRPSAGCGFAGLFSNDGSSPDWSPYKDATVADAITFEQDNRWSSNRYVGPWHFIVHEMDRIVGWDAWRGAPYHQDRGSSWQ
jgi:hypothetical protein